MDKHTTGPWFTTRPASFGTIYVEARLIAPVVQEVAAVGPTEGAGQQEANARLIAAAPDLLAALEAILSDAEDAEAFNRRQGWQDIAAGRKARINAARVAIAKAAGEASHD